MSSVTKRISQIKQPYGGYIKLAEFEAIQLIDEQELNESENVHGTIIGMTVDYLSRFLMGTDKYDAFRISMRGASIAETLFHEVDAIDKANLFFSEIKGLDDNSIVNACKLVTFDVWVRNTPFAVNAKKADQINPNEDTIHNIRVLVERCISFWKKYGPILEDGFTFEPDGYTDIVTSGDGDYLTKDTLWDIKVSKSKPKIKDTLQILMYWIMGQHSGQSIFSGVEYIGIFNPRLNMVWLKKVAEIDKNTIHEIESNVIGYRSDSIDISYDDESNNSGHQNDIGNPNYTQSNDELVDKIEELLAYKARTKRLLVLGIVLIPLFPISIVLLLIVLYRHHRQFSNKIVDISPSKNCINEKVSNCFERVWYELLRMNRLWLVSDISYSETKKNHAGADMLYNRQKMEVSDQLPEGLYSNQSIVVCKTSSIEIIFTPDKVIIIEKSRSVTVIFNKDLEINISNILYVEDEKIQEDAIVNRYVWEHPNKDGSPDRRYKQNKQLPECMYATIQIDSMNQNINIIFLASCYKTAQTMREIFMML